MIKKILLQVVIIAFFWICRVLYIAIAGDGLYIKPVEED